MNKRSLSRRYRSFWPFERAPAVVLFPSSPKKDIVLAPIPGLPIIDLSKPDLPKTLLVETFAESPNAVLLLLEDLPKPPVPGAGNVLDELPSPSSDLVNNPKCSIIRCF